MREGRQDGKFILLMWGKQILYLSKALRSNDPIYLSQFSMLVAQLYPTLCDPMDYTPPGSSVHGIIQARTLEWVAIFLLQGNFPTQRSNLPLLRLMHWQADSLPRGKPSYGQCTILNAVEDVRMKDTMFLTLSVQPEIHIYATTFRESCNHSDLHPLVSHFTFCFLGVSH